MNTGIHKFQIEKFFISNFYVGFKKNEKKKTPRKHLTKTTNDLIQTIM